MTPVTALRAPFAARKRHCRTFELREHGAACILPLDDLTGRAAASDVVEADPDAFRPGIWRVSPGRKVGTATVAVRGGGTVLVRIAPKVPVARLLFLLGYSRNAKGWREEDVRTAGVDELLPAMGRLYEQQAESALRQGLLQGYRTVEETALVVRGLVRQAEQICWHYDRQPPVEIVHDKYTTEIPENQLLRTACERLLRVPKTASWTVLRNDEAPGRRVLDQDHPCPPKASRACLPVLDRSVQPHLAVFGRTTDSQAAGDRDAVAAPLRRTPGPARPGTLRCGDTYAQFAAGFGIGIATVYRYIREAVEALSALAPSLEEAMRTIRAKAFVILDGTLLPIDRIAADTPYYSGKHKRHGMNVQVLTDSFGRLLWVSPALPGSTRDLTAARQHGIIEALADAGLKCWADRRIKAPAEASGCRSGAAASRDGSAATTPPTPKSAASASEPWPPSRAGASCGSSAAAPTESPTS
jgi:hypothetical protein